MRKFASVAAILLICAVIASADYTALPSPPNKATKYTFARPGVHFASSNCLMVNPAVESKSCYRDGVRDCRVQNGARCFTECERHVRNVCTSRMKVSSCAVPMDFEKEFQSRNDCVRSALDYCARTCTGPVSAKDCKQRAFTRCSYIGRMFV